MFNTARSKTFRAKRLSGYLPDTTGEIECVVLHAPVIMSLQKQNPYRENEKVGGSLEQECSGGEIMILIV